MNSVDRHYYRCQSCCHVAAIEGRLGGEVRCLCDGRLELLGRVARARRGLVLDAERCACDSRCTNAPGPRCECSCGGVNHGTGRVVPIEVDAGGVPRVLFEDEAVCRARAAEYAAAMVPLRARLRAMRQERLRDTPWRDFPTREEDSFQTALFRIVNLRTHKGRLAAIARLAA